MKVKVWMICIACFLLGSLLTILVLSINTQHIASKHCDDIIYYPRGDMVCEVKLSHQDDVVNVIVKE